MPESSFPSAPLHECDPTLHEIRLAQVLARIKATGARSVLDLGCGSGALMAQLAATSQFQRVVGLEQSGLSVVEARERLRSCFRERGSAVRLVCGSYTEEQPGLTGFDAAAMVETIEHVEPRMLSRMERVVFGQMRPGIVFVTTPNREYNPLFDLGPDEFREPDHKFEWDRARFRQWATGVARRNGYRVDFEDIGEADPWLGPPSQMAVLQQESNPLRQHCA